MTRDSLEKIPQRPMFKLLMIPSIIHVVPMDQQLNICERNEVTRYDRLLKKFLTHLSSVVNFTNMQRKNRYHSTCISDGQTQDVRCICAMNCYFNIDRDRFEFRYVVLLNICHFDVLFELYIFVFQSKFVYIKSYWFDQSMTIKLPKSYNFSVMFFISKTVKLCSCKVFFDNSIFVGSFFNININCIRYN